MVGPVVGTFFLLLYVVVIATIAIAMTKRYKGQFPPVITIACHVHVHTKLVDLSNLCTIHSWPYMCLMIRYYIIIFMHIYAILSLSPSSCLL